MSKIQVLDPITIDKIAAGEVIERPASVVKELVENAIDAGATAVVVEIKEGGISFMRITDNGCGIDREDVRSAFLRHSTSKIRSVDDLVHIGSLGFRGEALSSISAVSQVELITKTKDQTFGTLYRIAGGKEEDLEDTGAPDGTTFIIRQLFYNTPARRKFLKTPMTEASHVGDLMTRLALSHPHISFQFINNGQSKLHTSGNGKLKDVIYHIYGREIAANLLNADYESNGIKITGFLGKPVISRGNRNFENYYINGRYAKNNIIARAIEDGYKDFTMQHKYPFVVLHIEIDGEHVDVNVHPTKMELRFNNQQEVYNTIYAAIEQGLHEKQLIPHVEMPEPKAAPVRTEQKVKKPVIPPPQERNLDYFMDKMKERVMAEYEERKASKDSLQKNQESLQNQASDMQQNTAESKKDALQNVKRESQYISKNAEQAGMYNVVREEKNVYMAEKQLSSPEEANVVPEESSVIPEKSQEQNKQNVQQEYTDIAKNAKQMELFEDNLLTREAMQKYKVVGQVFETYWLVEYGNNLYIIDQHAAHERVLYEKTLKSMKTREFTSQMISPPIVLTLGMQEAELLETYMDQFTRIGFEIEEFGQDSYAVRAVPDNLFSIAKKDLLMEMIDSLSDEITRNLSLDLIDEKIASMSCKAAVKGNMKLSIQEVDALIGELLSLDNPYHCPHGRPTIIAMTKRELEKKFKRIV
nr:DNA mismatch repair endonuclease MutL [uncultured Dorea sp.]